MDSMTKDEIWWLIRSTFHSQSGLFLNKKQSEQVAEYILKLRDENTTTNTTN